MNYSAKQKGSSVTDKGPGRTPFAFIVFLLAFRFFADIHPALGSGGGFQLLQGQLDGGVAVARCHHRADSCTAGAFQATACAACSSSLLDSPRLSFDKSDLFDIVIKSL